MEDAEVIDYQNLKKSYIAALHMGLALKAGFEVTKRGNEILHKFCENCVDNSNYNEQDKQSMKLDLELVKEALSQEIKDLFLGAQ